MIVLLLCSRELNLAEMHDRIVTCFLIRSKSDIPITRVNVRVNAVFCDYCVCLSA